VRDQSVNAYPYYGMRFDLAQLIWRLQQDGDLPLDLDPGLKMFLENYDRSRTDLCRRRERARRRFTRKLADLWTWQKTETARYEIPSPESAAFGSQCVERRLKIGQPLHDISTRLIALNQDFLRDAWSHMPEEIRLVLRDAFRNDLFPDLYPSGMDPDRFILEVSEDVTIDEALLMEVRERLQPDLAALKNLDTSIEDMILSSREEVTLTSMTIAFPREVVKSAVGDWRHDRYKVGEDMARIVVDQFGPRWADSTRRWLVPVAPLSGGLDLGNPALLTPQERETLPLTEHQEAGS
jgi:hypothetical protein